MKIKSFSEFINENYSNLTQISVNEMMEIISRSVERNLGNNMAFFVERQGFGINGKNITRQLNNEGIITDDSYALINIFDGSLFCKGKQYDMDENNLKNVLESDVNLVIVDFNADETDDNITETIIQVALENESKTFVLILDKDGDFLNNYNTPEIRDRIDMAYVIRPR